MGRSLVTGGGGFVGRFIVRQLLARGDEVVVLGRRSYPALEASGADCICGDVADLRTVEAAATDCETVYHVAAIPGIWGDYSKYHRVNVLGTENVVAACRKNEVQRLVFTSSPSVVFDGGDHIDADASLPYPESYLCAYPRTKAEAERLVLNADTRGGLRTVSLRPHLVFGPEDGSLTPRVLQKGRRGRLRIVGDGANKISVAYVENVAAAHLQAADELAGDGRCGGRAYFINEREPVAVKDWISTLLSFGGLPPCNRHIPFFAAYTVGSFLETLWSFAFLRSEPPMTRFVALQLGRTHTYSIAAAEQDFGYRPIVEWDEAIERSRNWWQERG